MKAKSKIVTSNQDGVHKDLENILTGFQTEKYHRPISDFSLECYKNILLWLSERANLKIINLSKLCEINLSFI